MKIGRAIFFLLLACSSNFIYAFSERATDNAFAALLSMPEAGPENGQWDIPIPSDFTAGTESELIVYLAKQQKAGADFNAYRHFGTLLHHAIRAGKVDTAIWLLEHGADPNKAVKGNAENAPASAGDNAINLSQAYKRDKLVQILQKKYGLKLPAVVVSSNPAVHEPDINALMARIDTLSLTYTSAADYALAAKLLEATAFAAISDYPSPPGAPTAQQKIGKWRIFQKKMPAGVYAKLLDDAQVLLALIRMYSRSPAELDNELNGLPNGLLKRHAKAALAPLAEASHFNVSSDKKSTNSYSIPAESWRALWRHLDSPIDYSDWPSLAQNIQPELWPELFASGYNNHHARTALGCMPAQISAADFQALWPRWEVYFPDIHQVAPGMVLSHYRLAANDEYCWSWEPKETEKKLLFLADKGIHGTVNGIIKRELEYAPADLLVAMKPFMKNESTPQITSKPRLVATQANCSFVLSDLWYKELTTNAIISSVDEYAQVYAESVQLVEIPNETECGLLVGGYQRANDNYISGPMDSFTGPYENPRPSCPDPTDRYEVWRHHNGKIERMETDMGGDDGDPMLVPVRDTETDKRYYLHSGIQNGPCHSRERLPFLLKWQQFSNNWKLLIDRNAEDLTDALYEQCIPLEDGLQCEGITSPSDPMDAQAAEQGKTESATQDKFSAMDTQTFIRTFRKTAFNRMADVTNNAEFNQYLSAVLSLNKPLLKALQSHNIPGTWTAEAIKQVGTSSLTLTEKRKRTAWLFYDHAQLARALNFDVLSNLVDWLPREDWTPILSIISETYSGRDDYNLRDLRQKAQDKELAALACDIDHAQGLICGETWSSTQ